MSGAPEKHSVTIAGHRTSLSLEPEFWTALNQLAGHHKLTVSALISQIDADRGERNLSSAIRVYILNEVQKGYLF